MRESILPLPYYTTAADFQDVTDITKDIIFYTNVIYLSLQYKTFLGFKIHYTVELYSH